MGRPRNSGKRPGRYDVMEQVVIQHAAQSPLTPEKAAEKLAPIMVRDEESIKNNIIKARQNLHSAAPDIVEQMLTTAVPKAASKGNLKALLDLVERLQADGERVVEGPKAEQAGNGIRIILANVRMGGTKVQEPDVEVVDAEE